VTTDSLLRLVELETEARYARERYQLYRAKAYGPQPTSARRLLDLERTSILAAGRLQRAKVKHESGTPG
jgi:hypothetical protein